MNLLDIKNKKLQDEETVTVNNLSLNFVKSYLRVEHELDDAEITVYMRSALSFVRNYTKNKDGELDDELLIPVLALISHFYETKGTTMKSNEKKDYIFGTILDMQRGDIL